MVCINSNISKNGHDINFYCIKEKLNKKRYIHLMK